MKQNLGVRDPPIGVLGLGSLHAGVRRGERGAIIRDLTASAMSVELVLHSGMKYIEWRLLLWAPFRLLVCGFIPVFFVISCLLYNVKRAETRIRSSGTMFFSAELAISLQWRLTFWVGSLAEIS